MKRLALIALAVWLVADSAMACRYGGTSVYFDTIPAPPPEGEIVLGGQVLTDPERLSAYPVWSPEGAQLVSVLSAPESDQTPLYAFVTSCHHDLRGPDRSGETARVVGRVVVIGSGQALVLDGWRRPEGRWVGTASRFGLIGNRPE